MHYNDIPAGVWSAFCVHYVLIKDFSCYLTLTMCLLLSFMLVKNVLFSLNFSRSEFLGCMSFGIHHLKKSSKVIDGWYYLLTDDIGRRKHLQVGNKEKRRPQTSAKVKEPQLSSIPQKDDVWLDSHTVSFISPFHFDFVTITQS